MNKFLITLAALAAFTLSSVAHADGHSVKVSGFIQQIVGMGSDVNGGITEKFSRFGFSTETTTDNGWTVGGSMNLEMGNLGGGAGLSAYGPTNNSMYIQMDSATVTIGNNVSITAMLVPRIGAMGPGGGHDAGYQFLFDGGLVGSNGISFAESYYAMSNSSITVQAAAINGFTVGGTYTPAMEMNSADGIGRAGGNGMAATNAARAHGETTAVAASYAMEAEGIAWNLGASMIVGNSFNTVNSLNRDDASNNELSSVVGAIRATMGNMVIGAHIYNNGDSFGNSTDAIKASDAGYTVAATYAMGNISVGAGYAHQEMVRGTTAFAAATTVGTEAAGNVREDTITYVAVGYAMGGGVNTYVQLNTIDHSDGDQSTSEVDPTVIFAGISLGF